MLDAVNYFSYKNRPDKCGISQFPEVQFDCREISFFNDPGQGSGLQLFAQFVDEAFFVGGSQIDKINSAWHKNPPVVKNN